MMPDHPLHQLFNRRSRALARHLPRAVRGEARGVHQARVASRRLREAVPVLTAGLSGARRRSTVRTLRRITRALGLVREMDVSLAALAEDRWAEADRAAVALVASYLQRLRTARREEMLAWLGTVDRAKLRARLQRLGGLVEGVDTGPAWRAALETRLTRRSRALAGTVDAAGALYVPERLHAVRIAAKKLRYGLELAGEAEVASTDTLVRRLKHVQDMLGRLHDLQVLLAHAQVAQAESAGSWTLQSGAFDDLVGAIEAECRALHGRYLATAAGLFVLADEVTGRIAPEVAAAAANARRTPLKMALVADQARRVRR